MSTRGKSASRLWALTGLVVLLEIALLWMPPGASMLDARLHYTAEEAQLYLEALGPAGRSAYFLHECVDVLFIATYTMWLQACARRWSWLPQRLLFAPGAADLVETVGMLVLLRMDPASSRGLAAVVGYATSCKFAAFAAVGAAAIWRLWNHLRA